MQKKKIDIVVPCYNEGENVFALFSAIERVFSQSEISQKYQYTLIFVNDGSTDDTLENLKKLSEQTPKVVFLSFSRNFGHQLAVKAGLDYAMADAVISMDADLQHPAEIIPELLQKWEQGNQVVATIRTYPTSISKKKRETSKYFYKILNFISDVKIQEGAADFRLLDQSVVQVIRSMSEAEPFLRGIVPWVGFRQTYVPYVAQDRFSGQSKYTIQKMVRLALVGVTAFSVKPLYLAVYLGFVFSLSSLLYIPYVIWSFINGTEISGWASLIMTIVFFGGLQLIILGIMGIYVGKIFKQTKSRPNYIISEKNF